MKLVEWKMRIKTDIDAHPMKATLKKSGIPVALILEELAESGSFEEVLKRHEGLTDDDIRAALAYAAELAKENILPLSSYMESKFLRSFCS